MRLSPLVKGLGFVSQINYNSIIPTLFLGVMSCATLMGCQAWPPNRPLLAESVIKRQGWSPEVVQTGQFKHLMIAKGTNELQNNPHSKLYIFIEGDGVAWHNNRISRNPTPKRPLMLSLMGKSEHPSLYLGRPCYFPSFTHPKSTHAFDTFPTDAHSTKSHSAITHLPDCHPKWWTSHRYAPDIISSMVEALKKHRPIQKSLKQNPNHHTHQWIIVGHSGGGTLALLIAIELQKEMKKRVKVITLAGNIDPEAWTDLHGYSALTGSLNPIKLSQLKELPQHHLLGAEDTNTPPSLLIPILDFNSLKYTVLKGVTHTQGWLESWEKIHSLVNTIH